MERKGAKSKSAIHRKLYSISGACLFSPRSPRCSQFVSVCAAARPLQRLPLLSPFLCLHPEHISRPCSLHTNGIKLFTKCSCNLFPCGLWEQKIAHVCKQQPQSKGRCRGSQPVPQPLRLLPAHCLCSVGSIEGGLGLQEGQEKPASHLHGKDCRALL